ncbi:hypothetical protein SCACP_21500 [Sporomusa carbonis]|uniref:hypothetical protein n=1 Tax=Sporomusa carbonis TaxID=3076075 RepID=UPI003A60E4E8
MDNIELRVYILGWKESERRLENFINLNVNVDGFEKCMVHTSYGEETVHIAILKFKTKNFNKESVLKQLRDINLKIEAVFDCKNN